MSKNENNREYTAEEIALAKKDLISSIVIFAFGLFVLLSGLYMCFFAVTGTKVWYYSPGFLPVFIGTMLLLFSSVMFIKKFRAGVQKNSLKTGKEAKFLSKERLRLFAAVGLFALYVFVMIGRLPFVVSTFLYLAVTMFVFRTDQFAFWKILVISAVTTGAVYLFFGVIAAIPLP